MSPRSIEELVAEFVERREAGEDLDAAEFVAAHEECAAELERALAEFERTDALLPPRAGGVPDAIGPYRVLGELGRGGMGQVLRVERGGVEFALKLLHTSTLPSPRARQRMRREVDALRRLSDPGIVRVVDAGLDEAQPYYVMELVDGESLAALIERARASGKALDLPGEGTNAIRIARLVATLARAVQVAHDAELVHRDLKPANVLLCHGQPVLCDFGLAGGDTASTLTATGDVLGTPHYMAPEQARGEDATAATDVYGLGAVLYELLTLARPHHGDTSLRVLESVRRGPPPPLRASPDVPRALARIVRRALAFDPAHRHASAAELAAHLEAYAAGRASRGAGPMLRQRVAETASAHRRVFAGSGIALVGVAAVLASLFAARPADAEARGRALEQAVIARLAHDESGARAAGTALEAADPRDALGAFLARGETAEGDRFVEALARGDAAGAQKDWKAAAAAYTEATEARPGTLLAIASLGASARRAEQLDVAERELQAAVRMLPACAPLLFELGLAHSDRREWEPARQRLAEAIAAGADGADVHQAFARACLETGRASDALAAVDRAASARGERASDSLLRLRASILAKLDRLGEALPIWRELVARHPKSASMRYNLALALDSSHELRESADAYRALLALEPGRTDILACLAWLVSGSDRAKCARCAAAFEADPALLDFAAARTLALECLRADRGTSHASDAAIDVLARVGAAGEGREVVDALVADPALGDEALLRLSRGRQRLR